MNDIPPAHPPSISSREERTVCGLSHALREAKKYRFSTHLADEEKKELKTLSLKPPDQPEILKDGSRSKVCGHTLSTGRGIVLKYYYPKNLAKSLRNQFFLSRCERSWIAAHGFRPLFLPTPTPLAIREHSRFGLINTMSFLATDRATGTQLRFLETERMEAVAPALSQAFATMAEFHIAHGDLKATNIIVSANNEISFIDLDATQFQIGGKKWDQARAQDRDRFRKNWRYNPEADRILSPCID